MLTLAIGLTASVPGCVHWHRNDDGQVWLRSTPGLLSVPGERHCLRGVRRFRRFSLDEARQLLSGRHIALIGDSLTTYQYLSLVYWLRTGSDLTSWSKAQTGYDHPLMEQFWSLPYGRDGPKMSSLSLAGPGAWDNFSENEAQYRLAWNHYYLGTSRMLGGDEVCDCWRDHCFCACRNEANFRATASSCLSAADRLRRSISRELHRWRQMQKQDVRGESVLPTSQWRAGHHDQVEWPWSQAALALV